MEKDKQKVPDAIRLLTMKVIDQNTRLNPKNIMYGCWKDKEDFYFDTEEELDNFRLKNQLVIFPTFKVEFFGSVVGFKDVIKITSLTDPKDGVKNTALPAFKGTTIYTPTFEEYEENIVEEIVKTKKVKFLYGDIHPHKIYKKLQEIGVELETINSDWILEEQAAILEENIGSSVRKMVDDDKSPRPKIKPLATIYGCYTYDDEEKWFFSKKEFDSCYPGGSIIMDYTVIDFFGNVAGCQDVMKISTKCPNVYNFSCIYTPNFDGLDFSINNTVQKLGIGKIITFYGRINLTTVYDLLTENGITVETDYKNCGKQEGTALVKKPNEVSTPTN